MKRFFPGAALAALLPERVLALQVSPMRTAPLTSPPRSISLNPLAIAAIAGTCIFNVAHAQSQSPYLGVNGDVNGRSPNALATVANAVNALNGQHCMGVGKNLKSALSAYTSTCSEKVKDCDPHANLWFCSNVTMQQGPLNPVLPTRTATASQPTPVASDNAPAGNCGVSAPTLAAGIAAYAQQCSQPRVDCDPVAGEWICASDRVENLSPALLAQWSNGSAAATVATPTGTTEATAPVTAVATTPENTPENTTENAPGTAQENAPSTTPAPQPAAGSSPSVGKIGPNDLLALHYDNAPDTDDGHALVAGRVMTDFYRLNNVLAVNGAHGYQRRGSFNTRSESLFAAAWPNGLNAYRDWSGSVAASASLWTSVAANGNKIWVAEGGPSDFTADVLRSMPVAYRKQVHVVQHSWGWNEDNTNPSNLNFVRNASTYYRIANGNLGNNASADLNQLSSSFVQRALSSQWGALWQMAFNYLNPNRRLDFSDTVEFLWIVDVPVSQVGNVNQFADFYFK